MKRTLTPEQRARSDARRAQFRELAQQIGAMTHEQRAQMAERMAATVTVEGHVLSIHNACLLACQRPSATIVGGFNQWRAAGRMVRKGEHGLMIWAPARHSGPSDKPLELVGEVAPSAAELANDRPRFIMVTVFDVAQTDPQGMETQA